MVKFVATTVGCTAMQVAMDGRGGIRARGALSFSAASASTERAQWLWYTCSTRSARCLFLEGSPQLLHWLQKKIRHADGEVVYGIAISDQGTHHTGHFVKEVHFDVAHERAEGGKRKDQRS